jgi:endonuclease G, mitochondrial
MKAFVFRLILWIVAATSVQAQCINVPLPNIAGTEKVCHKAYTALYDAKREVPRLVAYELTGPHTLGCVPRASGFHAEGDSAKASAYDGTGYDLGHMDPAQDNAWDESVSKDSFSMINVAPQLPGLNRQEWERLEEDVRAWALQRGDLLVYVGPIFPKKPKLMNGVSIPTDFFKIVVDKKTGSVLAFQMPQLAIPKGDITPYLDPVSAIAAETGIKFSELHLKLDDKKVWDADLAAWHAAHKAACGKE